MNETSKKLLFGAAMSGMLLVAGCNAEKKSETPAPKMDEKVVGQCNGINSCKGQGSCHSKANSCAGKNSCKGEGWMNMSEEECQEHSGTFVKAES